MNITFYVTEKYLNVTDFSFSLSKWTLKPLSQFIDLPSVAALEAREVCDSNLLPSTGVRRQCHSFFPKADGLLGFDFPWVAWAVKSSSSKTLAVFFIKFWWFFLKIHDALYISLTNTWSSFPVKTLAQYVPEINNVVCRVFRMFHFKDITVILT